MSISFMNYDMIILWYIYVFVECIAHVLWDISVFARLQLTTYIRVVGTKGKHIFDAWLGYRCGWSLEGGNG